MEGKVLAVLDPRIKPIAVALLEAPGAASPRITTSQVWQAILLGIGATLLIAALIWTYGRLHAGWLRAWARLRARHYHWREQRKWAKKRHPEAQ